MINAELLALLLSAAAKFSGLPAIPLNELPPIQIVSADTMVSRVCPDGEKGCANLVAMFQTDEYVILLRDSLNLEDSVDNSFLVHELVHVLQFKQRGTEMFKDCPTTVRTENEAYRAQNAYLQREGLFTRFGEMLNVMSCTGLQGAPYKREVELEPNFAK